MPEASRTPRLLIVHESVTLTLSVAVIGYALWRYPIVNPQTAVFLGALCMFADYIAMEIPNMGSVSISLSMFLAAVLLGGPSTAAVVAVLGAVSIADIQQGRPVPRIAFNAAQCGLAATLAGLLLVGLGIPPLEASGGNPVSGLDWIAGAMMAAFVIVAVNAFFVGIAVALDTRTPVALVWREFFGWYSINMVALSLLGLILAELLYASGIPGTLLIVIPFAIARENFEVYRRQSLAYRDTVRSLVTAIEAKDPYTRGHSERVAWYANSVCQSLGLAAHDRQRVEWAALLHDIGKVALDVNTLTKPGQLSDDEYAVVKRHPEQAVDILRGIEFLADAVPLIEAHHERLDGQGYPAGLKEDDIPLGARILSVADSFDAMTSDRPYRRALTFDEAAQELRSGSGTQFDTSCVDRLLESVVAQDVARLLSSTDKLEGWSS